MKKIIALVVVLSCLLAGCSSKPLQDKGNGKQSGRAVYSDTIRSGDSIEPLIVSDSEIDVDASIDSQDSISDESNTETSTLDSQDDSKIQVATDNLSKTKNGYGQGVQVDDENRPYGAIDFNEKYSKFNATAIADGTEEKTIYLTFDQGYENGYTTVILDTLKEKNVKAIFFVLQDYAERNPELIERMINEGHVIGNHSKSHYSMPGLSGEKCKDEINSLHQYMIDNYNYEMNLFRPPMGEYSEFSLAKTMECGYQSVLWSYAYADWDVNNQPDYETAYQKLVKAAHPGAIYLLHSVSKTNSEVLPSVIDKLISEGYTFKVEN